MIPLVIKMARLNLLRNLDILLGRLCNTVFLSSNPTLTDKNFNLLKNNNLIFAKRGVVAKSGFCNQNDNSKLQNQENQVSMSGSKQKMTNTRNYKKILLIKLWGLGNLAVIWPLVNKIKEKYPQSYILFLTFETNREFLERNKSIDRIICLKMTRNIFKIITFFFSLLRKLNKEKVDLVINFETFNNAAALFSYLLGAPERIGLHNKYEKLFYTLWVDHNHGLHISETFKSLVSLIDVDSPYQYFYFKDSDKEKQAVVDLLRKHKMIKFICIHPGTSDNFVKKRWGAPNFIELSNALNKKYNIPLIFTGKKEEKKLIDNIINNISKPAKVFNLAGCLSIWEFVELLRKCSVFIANDTGPVHLAASLGVNIAAFYGPTSPVRYGPLNKNSFVFYKNIRCSPCVGIDYITAECKNNCRCLDLNYNDILSVIPGKFFNS